MERRVLAALMCIFFFAGGVFVPRASAQEKEEAGQARRTYVRGELRKIISVVKTDAPPTIDGVMDEGEWDAAAAITGLIVITDRRLEQFGKDSRGMIENVASHQSTFWITYDDENLYIAHHSPPPPEIEGDIIMIPAMLKRTRTIHDGCVHWDDSIHISIIDPVYPGGDKYVIQMNSTGTTFECAWYLEGYVWEKEWMDKGLGKMPGITLAWNPSVINKSTLTLAGWVIEAAIPWEGLGPHIKKPEPGETKYMNFGRVWQEYVKEAHLWEMDDELSPAGEVLFQGEEGIVVQLEDTGNLPRGQAAFAAKITNRFSSQRKVIAEVSTDSGELQDTKEITLAPGQSAPYTFKGMIGDFATTKIALSVRDASTGEVVHLTTLPVIRPTRPETYLYKYRSKDILKLLTDITYIGTADLKKASIGLTITSKETGKRVFRKTFRGFTSYQPALELSTKGWKLGKYDVRVVFNAPGLERYEEVIAYEYPPLPVWWNNRYGYFDMDNDRVPYPWSDMKVKDETITVWGRKYRFGKGLFPEQITTLDYPILRAPMRVLMKTADGEVIDTSSVESKSEWTKTNKTRVEGTRVADAKEVSLKNSFWAEYDGLVWCTLAIEPKKKVTIVSMELEIPLTKEFTDVINAFDYHLRHTGKLKPEGYIGYKRHTWLGNGEGGIQWVNSELEEDGFILKDTRKTVRVETGEEGATMRIVMIDTPTSFDAPHKIEFGFIATPVRPKITRTPIFRPSSIVGGGPFYPKGMEVLPAADPGYNYYGNRLYVVTTSVSTATDASGTEDFKHYGDEWLAEPFSRPHAAWNTEVVNTTLTSKSYRDYFVWRHWRFQQKYGYKGLYFDAAASPTLAAREIWKRLYNITLSNPRFAAREVNIGTHHSGMPNMAIFGFSSYFWDAENYNSLINEQQQTYLGIVDPAMFRAQHMGHNFGWPLRFLGQGRIRREWVEAAGGPEAVYDQLSGLVLLHDAAPSVPALPCCIVVGEALGQVEKRMTDALDRHNFYHWVYQFVPYWRQDIVKLPDENMHASFYIAQPSKLTATDPNEYRHRRSVFADYFDIYKHLPAYMQGMLDEDLERERGYLELLQDKAIMILYNNSEWEGEMHLKPDWKKLGFDSPENLKVENAVHSTGMRIEKVKNEKGEEVEKAVFFERPEEYAKIENGELVFPMTKWNYRMIVIEKEK